MPRRREPPHTNTFWYTRSDGPTIAHAHARTPRLPSSETAPSTPPPYHNTTDTHRQKKTHPARRRALTAPPTTSRICSPQPPRHAQTARSTLRPPATECERADHAHTCASTRASARRPHRRPRPFPSCSPFHRRAARRPHPRTRPALRRADDLSSARGARLALPRVAERPRCERRQTGGLRVRSITRPASAANADRTSRSSLMCAVAVRHPPNSIPIPDNPPAHSHPRPRRPARVRADIRETPPLFSPFAPGGNQRVRHDEREPPAAEPSTPQLARARGGRWSRRPAAVAFRTARGA